MFIVNLAQTCTLAFLWYNVVSFERQRARQVIFLSVLGVKMLLRSGSFVIPLRWENAAFPL